MAKTNRRPSDKFERSQRLASRPVRNAEETFVGRDWLGFTEADLDDTDLAALEAEAEATLTLT